MKRLVMIVLTGCLMALLIAMNYLVWENQNKSDTITTLTHYRDNSFKDLETLQQENEQLKRENARYKDTISTDVIRVHNYENMIDDLRSEMAQVKGKLDDREMMIDFLKDILNIEQFTKLIDEWILSINRKDYVRAYEIQNVRDAFDTKQIISLDRFVRYFTDIERIDLKSTDINLNDMNRIANREVVFSMIVDVTKKVDEEGRDDDMQPVIYDGANRAVLIFRYNDYNDTWYIYQITFYRYSMN